MKVESLYEVNRETGELLPVRNLSAPNDRRLIEATATEYIRGAEVRLTVRSEQVVRTEVIRSPNKDQRKTGIVTPWFRDSLSPKTSDRWLLEASAGTDLTGVQDGEWRGRAIGEKILGNPYNIEGHRVILHSLVPWVEIMDHQAEIPTRYGRVPFTLDDFMDWIASKPSGVAGSNARVQGIIWWAFDVPIAKLVP